MSTVCPAQAGRSSAVCALMLQRLSVLSVGVIINQSSKAASDNIIPMALRP